MNSSEIKWHQVRPMWIQCGPSPKFPHPTILRYSAPSLCRTKEALYFLPYWIILFDSYLLAFFWRTWVAWCTYSLMEGSITVLSRWHVFSLACVLACSYMFFVCVVLCCVVISCWLSQMVFGHVRMVSFYLVSLLPYRSVDFTWGVIRTKLFPCVAYGTP